MSGCNTKIPEKLFDPCEIGSSKISNITIQQPSPKELQVTKVIYNYKGKTEKQIKDSIQLEIDTFLTNWPSYKFVKSKNYFNKTDGLEMVLFFELK